MTSATGSRKSTARVSPMMRTSVVLTALVIGVTLLAAATAGAATITGTAGNDTLRGSAAADKLTGKRGNDKLYGGAGNDVLTGGSGKDLLVGGPGADKLSCGAGRDTARGDARDRIATDCEVVKGVPTTQAPPYVGPVIPGSYQGQTENGNPVFFTVRPDRTFTGWMVVNDLPNNCVPDSFGYFPGGDWLVDTTFSIRDDGTFDAQRSGAEPAGTILYERGQVIQWDDRIAGRFDTATSVSGSISMRYELEQRMEFWPPAHLYCSTGPISWSATLQPPQVAPVTPGSYQGQTQNGNPVLLTVRSDRTFTGWLVVNDLPNNCGYSPGEEWFADTTFSIRDNGTFDAQRSWDGSIIPHEGGQLTHWEGRIAGRFDTATSVSGTIVMTYTLEEHDIIGPLLCFSRYMTWSATLRS